jgi:transcriptional regulator with XRE-family HTH domain
LNIGIVANLSLKTLGNRIRAERERKGISQERLAELATVHRTYIGGIERGERNVAFLNILKIARALSVPPSSLLVDFKSSS